MSYDQTTIEAVMATLHVVGQPPIRGVTDKLASVEVGSPEAFYLLATYCFDLTRKLEYFTKIARPFAEQVPPELASEILQDTEDINAGSTWQQRAIVAQQIMIRLYQETGEEHDRLLLQSANRVGS